MLPAWAFACSLYNGVWRYLDKHGQKKVRAYFLCVYTYYHLLKYMKKYILLILICILWLVVVSIFILDYALTLTQSIGLFLCLGILFPGLLLYLWKTVHKNKSTYKPDDFSEAWRFCTFMKFFGPKIQRASHTNGETQAVFHTLEISDYTGKTVSVRFSSYLGELSTEELRERKDELFIGKRKDNHRWYLYDKNYVRREPWECINIEL